MSNVIRETEYTKVVVQDEPGMGNACHDYTVDYVGSGDGQHIVFQKGAILEHGVNGVQNEDLLAIVIHRLRGFQSGNFAGRENAIALTHIEEAIMWLDKRTADRKTRGVEGKNIV